MSQRKVTTVYPDTGAVMQFDPVFTLGGLFEVVISSTYVSDFNFDGILGRNRASDLDPRLVRLDNGQLEYRDAACMAITFDQPTPNPGQWNPGGHIRFMEIAAGPDRTFMIREEGTVQHFTKFGEKSWQLTAIENRNGARLEMTRDKAGLLTGIHTPEGLGLAFQNDAARGLRLSADLIGQDGSTTQVMRYAYDTNGNMTLAESPFGDTHDYRYDSENRLEWVRINQQFTMSHKFDDAGRCVLQSSNGPYDGTQFDYDTDLRITKIVPGGDESRTERLYYGEDGAIFAEAHVSGRFKRTYYSETGQITSEQDGNGNRIKYRYDPAGYLNTVEDPEGRTSDFRWDDAGQMQFAIDPIGAAWESDYDELGNLIGTKDALGFDTEIKVNDMGQPTGICRHDGFIRFMTYDENHMLHTIVDFDGLETTLERDTFGRVIATTAADQQRTDYAYEEQEGWDFWTPSTVRLNDGIQFQTKVKGPRRHLSQIDATGRETQYFIDAFGKAEETRDPTGGILKFRYDMAEDLSEVENQAGQTWRFDRDAFGRVSQETDFGGTVITYTYDDADQLIRTDYADGTSGAFTYDKSGLMTHEVMTVPDQEPVATDYTFDERGLLQTATTVDSTVSFERDMSGQVVAEIINGTRIENTYDCCGRRNTRSINDHTVRYGHDPAGRLASLQIGTHDPLAIMRDTLGHEVKRDNGLGFALNQTFDPLGLLRKQGAAVTIAGGRGGSQFDIARTYQWNQSLEPTEITNAGWGAQTYTYNRNGQITQTAHGDGAVERFDYDTRLNIEATRLTTPLRDGSGSVDNKFLDWQSGPDGRVTTALGPRGEIIKLTYDAKGRVVEKQVDQDGFRPKIWQFTWNGLDRMTSAHTPDGDKWTYGYDAFARRLWKQQWTPSDAPLRGAVKIAWVAKTRHAFLWDGDVIASETITTAKGQTRHINWYFEPETFVPIAREESGALSYVLTDHLGTPREIVSQTGALEWACELSTWGSVRRAWVPDGEGNPEPSLCPIRFQGQWEDAETGLYYNRFRYFDSQTGSFNSTDPIRLYGGLSLFSVTAAPTRVIDPMGLSITYLPLDALGRPTGATAVLRNGQLGGGTAAASRIRPPGFVSGLPPHCHNRGHLIGRQLGGSGRDARNLVTLTNGSNSPAMRNQENRIRNYLRQNPRCSVRYTVTPIYEGDNPMPVGVTMHAISSNGQPVAFLSIPNGLTVAPC